MAEVTGKTAAAMDAIAAACIVNGIVNGSGHLILTKQDTTTVDAGNVIGPTGPAGTNGADGTTLDLHALTTDNPTTANWGNNGKKIQNTAAGGATGEVATYEQVALKSGTTFTGRNVPAIASLTFAATILINAALANYFRVTLTASTGTLDAPSNPADGQPMIVEISQDATGGRTMAWNAAYLFSTSFPSPTLSTGANAIDILGFVYNAAKSKWLCVGQAIGAA